MTTEGRIPSPLDQIKALYATMTVAEQDALRNEFFGWQPRCPRCGTPKYLGSVGCAGPGREHMPARKEQDR